MRIAIRSDSGTQVGGGHVMRCLSLALAAREAGHEVRFVCAEVEGHLGDRITSAGFKVSWLSATDTPAPESDIESWRPMPIAQDAEQTIAALQDFALDWIILDHYGLGGTWVKAMRAALPNLRTLALDDLDREPLFADMLLNPAAFPDTQITQQHMAMLKGPSHALLRPEFRTLRSDALKRRTGEVQNVLILPGMVDNLGFGAAALTAMRDLPNLKAEVVMGSQSPLVPQIKALVADVPNWSLTLDATDMAERLHSADLAIGAGGVSAWERCCLGLPAVNVALAENQEPGVQAIAKTGAAVGLDASALQDPTQISDALQALIANYQNFSQNAADLCDGNGAARVISAMSGTLRPVAPADAKLIFDWRNQDHIREASLNADPFIWENHVAYLEKALANPENHLWCIYQEDGADLGLTNAKRQVDGSWVWGFYIGAASAPKGAGRRMLVQFLRRLSKTHGFSGVEATVLAANPRSRALHESLGFRLKSDKPAPELHLRLDAATLHERLGTGE